MAHEIRLFIKYFTCQGKIVGISLKSVFVYVVGAITLQKHRTEDTFGTRNMTNAVSNISTPQNAPQQVQTNAAASTSSNNAFNSVDTKPLTGSSNTPISPRLVVDPMAGVITQFLSATGTVESQIPSAAVVAYLRAGLTADGQTKPTPETQKQANSQNPQTGNSVLA
jgi:hypothetical protein